MLKNIIPVIWPVGGLGSFMVSMLQYHEIVKGNDLNKLQIKLENKEWALYDNANGLLGLNDTSIAYNYREMMRSKVQQIISIDRYSKLSVADLESVIIKFIVSVSMQADLLDQNSRADACTTSFTDDEIIKLIETPLSNKVYVKAHTNTLTTLGFLKFDKILLVGFFDKYYPINAILGWYKHCYYPIMNQRYDLIIHSDPKSYLMQQTEKLIQSLRNGFYIKPDYMHIKGDSRYVTIDMFDVLYNNNLTCFLDYGRNITIDDIPNIKQIVHNVRIDTSSILRELGVDINKPVITSKILECYDRLTHLDPDVFIPRVPPYIDVTEQTSSEP